MRVNLDWLNEWADVGHDLARIEDELTSLGLEVDSTEALARVDGGVVVAEVLRVERHPNADRLSVCAVDDGSGEHQVVCGARNVAPGIKAPFARVGAQLPGGRPGIVAIPEAGLAGLQHESQSLSLHLDRFGGLGENQAGEDHAAGGDTDAAGRFVQVGFGAGMPKQ